MDKAYRTKVEMQIRPLPRPFLFYAKDRRFMIKRMGIKIQNPGYVLFREEA